jgi:type II secretory ATPase GspE/PulE/Tfp pilus assembly ATPase PilB-like protein
MECFMHDLLLIAVEFGGYISPVKLVLFLIVFFLWILLVNWVNSDAKNVGTKDIFWTGIVFGAGAIATLAWLIMPVFSIGLLFHLIIVGTTSIAYVMHRNARVPDFNRVLTLRHLKGLLSNEKKQVAQLENMVFITANNNEVPVPQPKTADFYGYQAAYKLLLNAVKHRASDIIFSPTAENYQVSYYVDGATLKQPAITKEQADYFNRFIKSLADLDINEKRKPQKGKFRVRHEADFSDWQVTAAGSTAGEQINLKHLTKEDIIRLDDLNLTAKQLEQLRPLNQAQNGLFIVAGPKKSGVTTTFYALLRNHDPYIYGVSTLERQPSAEFKNISQNIYTLSDTGTTTYAKKLQAIIRAEPDVIGVANCTDPETAQVACKAAKEKVVYVVLEAENAIKAMAKWIKLVGDTNLAVSNLVGISNQRLLRKLCEKCKQAYEPNKELFRKFNIPAEKTKVLYRAADAYYNKRGKASTCDNCHGLGLVGRMGVFEIIMMNNQLRKAVVQSKSLSEINTQFRRAKMLYLQEQALRHVIAGTTAINEMVRILSSPKQKKSK